MAWNYSRAVEYADAKAVSMPGTERINALMRALGDPQSRLLRVHVAGSRRPSGLRTPSPNSNSHIA